MIDTETKPEDEGEETKEALGEEEVKS